MGASREAIDGLRLRQLTRRGESKTQLLAAANIGECDCEESDVLPAGRFDNVPCGSCSQIYDRRRHQQLVIVNKC
jgi:hypothetical protein